MGELALAKRRRARPAPPRLGMSHVPPPRRQAPQALQALQDLQGLQGLQGLQALLPVPPLPSLPSPRAR